MKENTANNKKKLSATTLPAIDIVRAVEEFYMIRLSDVRNKYIQKYPSGVARMMMIYLLHTLCRKSGDECASMFCMSRRNIHYICRNASSLIKSNGKFSSDYNTIISKIKP